VKLAGWAKPEWFLECELSNSHWLRTALASLDSIAYAGPGPFSFPFLFGRIGHPG